MVFKDPNRLMNFAKKRRIASHKLWRWLQWKPERRSRSFVIPGKIFLFGLIQWAYGRIGWGFFFENTIIQNP
jgi:hypothetical protein